MTNKEILSNSVSQWATPIVQEILPNVNIPKMGFINNFMGKMLGIDLSNYNIWNEFSFLFNDLIGDFINPQIDNFLNNLHIPEDKIPEFYPKVLNSCINHCREKGFLNVFGLQFDERAFQNLKSTLDTNFSNANKLKGGGNSNKKAPIGSEEVAAEQRIMEE